MQDIGCLYRYEERSYSYGVDQWDNPLPGSILEINLCEFEIKRVTPKGVWINTWPGQKFVLLSAYKKWACKTKAEALKSFKARKKRQIEILKLKLCMAEKALDLAMEEAN